MHRHPHLGAFLIWLGLLALLGFLWLVGPAHAATLVSPDGVTAQPYQAWADRSLVPTVAGEVTLILAPCPGHPTAPGCHPIGTATIYENEPVAAVTGRTRFVLYHELGHLYDSAYPAARRATRLGTEQFANAYALCAARRTIHRRWNDHDYGYRPTPRQHARNCKLIRAKGPVSLPRPTPRPGS